MFKGLIQPELMQSPVSQSWSTAAGLVLPDSGSRSIIYNFGSHKSVIIVSFNSAVEETSSDSKMQSLRSELPEDVELEANLSVPGLEEITQRCVPVGHCGEKTCSNHGEISFGV